MQYHELFRVVLISESLLHHISFLTVLPVLSGITRPTGFSLRTLWFEFSLLYQEDRTQDHALPPSLYLFTPPQDRPIWGPAFGIAQTLHRSLACIVLCKKNHLNFANILCAYRGANLTWFAPVAEKAVYTLPVAPLAVSLYTFPWSRISKFIFGLFTMQLGFLHEKGR